MEYTDREHKYEVFGIDRMIFDADAAAYLPVGYKKRKFRQNINPKRINDLIYCYDDDGFLLKGVVRLDAMSNCVQVSRHRTWMRIRRWAFEPKTEEEDEFLRSAIPERWHRKIRQVGSYAEVESYYPTPPWVTLAAMPSWMHGITLFDADGEVLPGYIQEIDFQHNIAVDREGVEHEVHDWKVYAQDEQSADYLREHLHPHLRDHIVMMEAA